MTVSTRHYEYQDDGVTCEGFVAVPSGGGKRPCVLIAHQWAGLIDHERGTAERLALNGYVGFAIDVYGKGRRGEPMADNSHLMNPFLQDRAMLRRRLLAALAAAHAHPDVDAARIAIMGYCFGGLCALDLARSGTSDVRGAVSVHGIFAPPGLGDQPAIPAKILVLHGWDDPMATPDAVVGLARELSGAGCDWQLHAYGNTMHAFTAVGANAPQNGIMYNADADRRSWQATLNFLAELFG
jgi:dienelactone hydrolase